MELFQVDEQLGLEVINKPGLPDLSGYVPKGKDLSVEDIEDTALFSGFWVEQERAGNSANTRASYFEDPELVDKEVGDIRTQQANALLSQAMANANRDDISQNQRARARRIAATGVQEADLPDTRYYSYDQTRMADNIELYLDRVDPDGRLTDERRAAISAGIYEYGMKNEGGFSTRLIGMEQKYHQSKAIANYRDTTDIISATASQAIPNYINEGIELAIQLQDTGARTDLTPDAKVEKLAELQEQYDANQTNMAGFLDKNIAMMQLGTEALGRDYGVLPGLQSELYSAARNDFDRTVISSGGMTYGSAIIEGEAAQTAEAIAAVSGREPSEINKLGSMARTAYSTGAIRDTVATLATMVSVQPGGLSEALGAEHAGEVSDEVMAVIDAFKNDFDVQSVNQGELFKAEVLGIMGEDESYQITGKLSSTGTAMMRDVARRMSDSIEKAEMWDDDAAGIQRDIDIALGDMSDEQKNDFANNLRREYINFRADGKITMESWLHSVRSYPYSMVQEYRNRHRPVAASDEFISGVAPIIQAAPDKYRNAIYEEVYSMLNMLEDPTGDQNQNVEFMINRIAAMAADGQSTRYADGVGRTGTVSSSPAAARAMLSDGDSIKYEEEVFATRPNVATGVQGFTKFGDFVRALQDTGFSERDANSLVAASGAMGGHVLRTGRDGVPGSIVITGDPISYSVDGVDHEFVIGFELEDSVEVRGSGKARNLRHPDFDVVSHSDQTTHSMAAVEIINGEARYRSLEVEGTGANMRITKVSDYDESVTIVPGQAIQKIANNSGDLIGVATDSEMMVAYFDYLRGREPLPETVAGREQLGADAAENSLRVAENIEAIVNNTGLELPADTSAALDFRLEMETLHNDLFGYAIGRVDGSGNKMPMQLPLGTVTNAEGYTVDDDGNYELAEDFYTSPPEEEAQQIIIPESVRGTIETIWETEGLMPAQQAVAEMISNPLYSGVDFRYVGGKGDPVFQVIGEGFRDAASAVGGFFKRIRPGAQDE